MHSSELLERLHSELRILPAPGSSSTADSAFSAAVAAAAAGEDTSSADGDHADMLGVGILDAIREAGVPQLDRDVAFLLYISPHGIFHNEFLHHYNDDTVLSAVNLPVRGFGASSANNSANNAKAVSADTESSLLTSQAAEESPEAHTLASIRWLISAARSALKAMYEHNASNISRNQSTIREIRELTCKLQEKRGDIVGILADWKRVSMCMELCSNYKAQISLLLEKFKFQKKLSSGSSLGSSLTWNASGASSGDGAAVSTMSMIDASNKANSLLAQKDAEVQMAVSKMVQLQLQLESNLQRLPFEQMRTSGSAASLSRVGGEFERLSMKGGGAAAASASSTPKSAQRGVGSGSKLAALAGASPMNHQLSRRSSPYSTPTRGGGVDYFHDTIGGGPGSGARFARAPNPLHVVMQSLFTSSTTSAVKRK
jgi:hypothetical protein